MIRSLRHNFPKHPNIKKPLVYLTIIFASAFISVASAANDSPDFLKPNTNILFLGDSITQGGTYIAYIDAYLWSRYPGRQYNLINLGLGSETKRLKGKSLQGPGSAEYSYKAAYQDYDQVLENYSTWILEEGLNVERVIDIHTPLEKDIAEQRLINPVYEYGDGIHPNDRGHFVLARTILEGLNAPGAGTLPDYSDLPANSSIAKAMPSILKRHNSLSAAWREHVGHSKPKKETVPSLKEATRLAKIMEIEIRWIMSSRIVN